MIDDKYGYPWEKLAAARRALMAPHPSGEASGYADAFYECSLGLQDLRFGDLDDSARSWVATIERTMDTTGIEDPSGLGTWRAKAESLSETERFEFSSAVDELAHWLYDRHMGVG